jgi:hypothetical protein
MDRMKPLASILKHDLISYFDTVSSSICTSAYIAAVIEDEGLVYCDQAIAALQA